MKTYQILFVCNEGFSTSVIAAKLSKFSQDKDIVLSIEAIAEPQVIQKYKDVDALFVAPQLSYMRNKLSERIENAIPVDTLPAVMFGRVDLEGLYQFIINKLEVK